MDKTQVVSRKLNEVLDLLDGDDELFEAYELAAQALGVIGRQS